MKKLLGAVLPLLLAFLGTSCAFEGAVTTTATTTATISSAAADE